ncbi:MAG: DUF1080 domain-containing protein [bacterium]|nr:DUF1080 domain-containing protein [bacterium]
MAEQKKAPVGYDDTPFLPGNQWRVHDINRPQPRVVTPGASVGDAPSDAVVLFDGTDLSKWQGRDGSEAEWKIEGGYMEAMPGSGNIQTKEAFGDCQLHIEFACPAEVVGDSQGRGNSGVFLIGEYEIQVLDGYNNRTYADGTTSAIYGEYPPRVNACRPPGEWQSYDIVFEAPRYDGDGLVSPAYLTVLHNGLIVHNRQAALGPTGHKNLANYDEAHGPTGPLMLQDHKNPTRFRNIWIRALTDYDEA